MESPHGIQTAQLPPPLKTASIQQSYASISLSGPPRTSSTSKEVKLQHPPFDHNGDQWWGPQKIVLCVEKETVVRSKRRNGCPPVPIMPGAERDRRQSDSRQRRRPTISRLRGRCRLGFSNVGGPKHEYKTPNSRLWNYSPNLEFIFSGFQVPRVVRRHPPEYQTPRRSMSSVLGRSLTSSQTLP